MLKIVNIIIMIIIECTCEIDFIVYTLFKTFVMNKRSMKDQYLSEKVYMVIIIICLYTLSPLILTK